MSGTLKVDKELALPAFINVDRGNFKGDFLQGILWTWSGQRGILETYFKERDIF